MIKTYERLFFGLWPTPEIRENLCNVATGIPEMASQGRLIPSSNLHITLHFLGNISIHKIDCFLTQANKVKANSFELNMDMTGYFKKPRVFWIGCKTIPEALISLHSQLGELIKSCSYKPELRLYRPHVSIIRNLSQPAQLMPINPVLWPVNRFVLIRSISHNKSVEYQVKSSFPLISST